jgi:hypothetical protein
MSIAVALDELRRRVDEYGPHPFLVTADGSGGTHVVSVAVRFDGEQFSLSAGRTTLANIDASATATLLWPGSDGRYCLIVDGEAHHHGDVANVRPTRAVLHRLAGAPADLPSCVSIERTD